MTGLATLEQFDALEGKRQFGTFDVEGFGKVRLRSMSEGEISEWQKTQIDATPDDMIRGSRLLIIKSVVNNDGDLFLTEDHLDKIADWPSHVVQAIIYQVRKLNGLLHNDEEVVLEKAGN